MPSFIEPDAVRFDLRDGEPVLTLATDAPDGAVDGWTLVNRMTMCVVDGPGDAGFLLPRMSPTGDLAPAGWDEAVERSGGCTVVFRERTVFATSLG